MGKKLIVERPIEWWGVWRGWCRAIVGVLYDTQSPGAIRFASAITRIVPTQLLHLWMRLPLIYIANSAPGEIGILENERAFIKSSYHFSRLLIARLLISAPKETKSLYVYRLSSRVWWLRENSSRNEPTRTFSPLFSTNSSLGKWMSLFAYECEGWTAKYLVFPIPNLKSCLFGVPMIFHHKNNFYMKKWILAISIFTNDVHYDKVNHKCIFISVFSSREWMVRWKKWTKLKIHARGERLLSNHELRLPRAAFFAPNV